LKRGVLIRIDDLKENSNKQMNEIKKLIQDLDEKFNKEIGFVLEGGGR
jgi:hypothetical protein